MNEGESQFGKSDKNSNLFRSYEKYSFLKGNNKMDSEKFNNLLIFATNNVNHVNTWVSVIDFLIKKGQNVEL
jgi:hypothetical protein